MPVDCVANACVAAAAHPPAAGPRLMSVSSSSRGLALLWSRGREELLGLGARAAAVPPAGRARPALRRHNRLAGRIRRMVEIYAPYTTLSCRFDDSGAQALAAEMDAEEHGHFPFDTAAIDWIDYLERVHLPRLHEMVADAFAGRDRPASAG